MSTHRRTWNRRDFLQFPQPSFWSADLPSILQLNRLRLSTESPSNARLTGAALNRLTHCCHILKTKGESYRLQESKRRMHGKRTK